MAKQRFQRSSERGGHVVPAGQEQPHRARERAITREWPQLQPLSPPFTGMGEGIHWHGCAAAVQPLQPLPDIGAAAGNRPERQAMAQQELQKPPCCAAVGDQNLVDQPVLACGSRDSKHHPGVADLEQPEIICGQRGLGLHFQTAEQGAVEHALIQQFPPRLNASKEARHWQEPVAARQQVLMQGIRADSCKTCGESMGTAAQAQQLNRRGGAVAAVMDAAEIALEAELLGQDPVAPTDGGLTEIEQLAGPHGVAGELQQIEHANVLEKPRQAIAGPRMGLHSWGRGKRR